MSGRLKTRVTFSCLPREEGDAVLVAEWGFPHGSHFEKAVGHVAHGIVNPAEPSPLKKPKTGEDASTITQGHVCYCQSTAGVSGVWPLWLHRITVWVGRGL